MTETPPLPDPPAEPEDEGDDITEELAGTAGDPAEPDPEPGERPT